MALLGISGAGDSASRLRIFDHAIGSLLPANSRLACTQRCLLWPTFDDNDDDDDACVIERLSMSKAEEVEVTADDGSPDAPEDVDIALAMGFGSFGAKPHLKKKRKLDEPNARLNVSHSLPVRPEMTKAVESQPLPSFLREGLVGEQLPASDERQGVDDPHYLHATGSNIQPLHSHSSQRDGIHQYSGTQEAGTLPSGDWVWHALRRGVRNEHGDIAYFDASFVEDPWKELRKNS